MKLEPYELVFLIGDPQRPLEDEYLAKEVAKRIVELFGLAYKEGLGGLGGYFGERAKECRELLQDIQKLLQMAYDKGVEDGTKLLRRLARGDISLSEIS